MTATQNIDPQTEWDAFIEAKGREALEEFTGEWSWLTHDLADAVRNDKPVTVNPVQARQLLLTLWRLQDAEVDTDACGKALMDVLAKAAEAFGWKPLVDSILTVEASDQ